MAIWPFRSKARQPSGPKFEDDAFVDLARMFLRFPQDPTPGNELLDASRFDLSVESLGAMDEHLERMRLRDLEGQDLLFDKGLGKGQKLFPVDKHRLFCLHYLGALKSATTDSDLSNLSQFIARYAGRSRHTARTVHCSSGN